MEELSYTPVEGCIVKLMMLSFEEDIDLMHT